MENRQRIGWLDAVRAFAILCVVLCHAAEGVYPLKPEGVAGMALHSKMFAFGAFTVGRLGVPLFLMITGYLLLDRPYDRERTRRFLLDKALGLAAVIAFWIVVYNAYLIGIGRQGFSAVQLLQEILLVRHTNMSHIWYLPMILSMYLCIPAAANMLRSTPLCGIVLPTAILGAYAFGVPTVNVLLQAAGREALKAQVEPAFTGGVYGIYLLLGWLCKKGMLKGIKGRALVLTAAASLCAMASLQIWAYGRGHAYNLRYDNLLLPVCALGVFGLAPRVERLGRSRFCAGLAKYSFGIYLIHNPIRLSLIRRLRWIEIFPVRMAVVLAVSLLGSWLLAYLIARIPRVGKRILFMK